jgi:DNA-binding transcriptional LysR family regulator
LTFQQSQYVRSTKAEIRQPQTVETSVSKLNWKSKFFKNTEMNDLDLTTLRLFIAVCDARSISRVAEGVRMDASAITRRINKLESQAGKPLLRRVRSGVEATPEGLQFCEISREFVRDAANLSEKLAMFRGDGGGRITVAANSHVVSGRLTQDLADFMSLPDAKGLSIAIQEMTSSEIVQSVRDGRYALGVYWDNVETSGLQSDFFYSDQFCCVLPAGHSLAQAQDLTYAQVTNFNVVGMRTNRQAEAYVSRVGAIDAPRAKFIIEAPTHEAALRLTAAGMGVFVTSMSVFNTYKHCWDLVALPISDLFPLQFRLAYRTPESLPLGARRLIKHLSSAHADQQKPPIA